MYKSKYDVAKNKSFLHSMFFIFSVRLALRSIKLHCNIYNLPASYSSQT